MSAVFYLLNFSVLFSYIFPFAHKQIFTRSRQLTDRRKLMFLIFLTRESFYHLKYALSWLQRHLPIRVSLDVTPRPLSSRCPCVYAWSRPVFVSRTQFEFGPTQVIKNTPVDSNVELNSPNLIYFEPKHIRKKKLSVKYVTRIYALCLTHEKFDVWIKAVPKPKFPVELFQIRIAVFSWFRCRILHVLNSVIRFSLLNLSALELQTGRELTYFRIDDVISHLFVIFPLTFTKFVFCLVLALQGEKKKDNTGIVLIFFFLVTEKKNFYSFAVPHCVS